MKINIITGGLWSFGCPEYGALGHNTDGKYFVTATKLTYHFEKVPRKIVLFVDKSKDGHFTPLDDIQITDFACGYHHTVAIDAKNRAFSWGFGGFGRLGHNEQKDEFVPRLIKLLEPPNRGVKAVFCGSTFSFVINVHGTVLLMGQTKRTGEANMYPKPVQDFSGWDIRCIACSNTSVMVAADESVIGWGASPTYGELVRIFEKSASNSRNVKFLNAFAVSINVTSIFCFRVLNLNNLVIIGQFRLMRRFFCFFKIVGFLQKKS